MVLEARVLPQTRGEWLDAHLMEMSMDQGRWTGTLVAVEWAFLPWP